jgi:uncharacterized protein YkwD
VRIRASWNGSIRRTRQAAALTGIVAVAVVLGPTAPASGQALAAGAELRAVETSVLTLLNAERAKRGLKPLRRSATLAIAARWQSRDMVAHRYFDHQRRGGPGVVQRIRRAGYLRHTASWTVGENIAWGLGSEAAPDAIVAGWMRSAGHRHNILNRTFESVGIGLVADLPTGERGGTSLTITTDFGFRSFR